MASSKTVSKKRSKIAGCAAFCAAALFAAFFIFWRLDADTILGFDEGRHAVNALEMYRSKDLIVTTYNGEIDYFNLKPPLSVYMMAVQYAIFGVNLFAIRFGAACCYFLTALLSALYVAHKRSFWAGSLTLLLFGCSKHLLLDSMARKGDANALYNLFFTGAMLLLLILCERKRKAQKRELLLYAGIGLLCAAAFLTKSFHAGVPLLIVLIVFFALGKKRTALVEWGAFAGSCALPVLVWALLRYTRDGFTFLKGMLFEDVLHRSAEVIAGTEGGFFYYFQSMFQENSTLVVVFFLGIGAALLFYEGGFVLPRMKNGREWLVPALWVVLPCLIFAIPKTKLITYVYPSYIGLYVCGGLVLPGIVKQAKSVLAKVVLAVACCFGVLLLSFNVKADYKRIAGETTDSFEELLLEHAELFSGEGNIYTNHINEKMDGVWMQDELLAIDLYTSLHCVDGSIEGYRNDEGECYLILNYIWTSPEDNDVAEGRDGSIIYQDADFVVLKK